MSTIAERIEALQEYKEVTDIRAEIRVIDQELEELEGQEGLGTDTTPVTPDFKP